MKNLRIVFMGTPEFAVAALGSLLMNGFNVVAVITSPDKPSGRGQKVTQSQVKQCADFSHLPVLQPSSLKDPEFIKKLSEFKKEKQVLNLKDEEKRIASAKRKIEEAESELRQMRNQDKIIAAERKLAEDQRELARLKSGR